MEILYTARFEKDFRKLSKHVKESALERELWFRADPFDSRLKTHRLHGKLVGLYAFSLSGSHRVLFEFGDSKGRVHFLRIGSHDIYD